MNVVVRGTADGVDVVGTVLFVVDVGACRGSRATDIALLPLDTAMVPPWKSMIATDAVDEVHGLILYELRPRFRVTTVVTTIGA